MVCKVPHISMWLVGNSCHTHQAMNISCSCLNNTHSVLFQFNNFGYFWSWTQKIVYHPHSSILLNWARAWEPLYEPTPHTLCHSDLNGWFKPHSAVLGSTRRHWEGRRMKALLECNNIQQQKIVSSAKLQLQSGNLLHWQKWCKCDHSVQINLLCKFVCTVLLYSMHTPDA